MNKEKKNSNLKSILEKWRHTIKKSHYAPQIPHKIKLCKPDIHCGHTYEKQAILEKREGLLLRTKDV